MGELALMIVVQNTTAVMCHIKASFTDIDLFRRSKVCIWPEQLWIYTWPIFKPPDRISVGLKCVLECPSVNVM